MLKIYSKGGAFQNVTCNFRATQQGNAGLLFLVKNFVCAFFTLVSDTQIAFLLLLNIKMEIKRTRVIK